MILRLASALVFGFSSAASASTVTRTFDLLLTPMSIYGGVGSEQFDVPDAADLPAFVSSDDCYVHATGSGATCVLPSGMGLLDIGRAMAADVVVSSNLGTSFVVRPTRGTVTYAEDRAIGCSAGLAALFRFCDRPETVDPRAPYGTTVSADVESDGPGFAFRYLEGMYIQQEVSDLYASVEEDSASTVTIGGLSFAGSDGFGVTYAVEVMPAAVPLPAGLPLMAGAFGLLGLLHRARRRTPATGAPLA